MKTLKDVKVGETATVVKLHGEGPVKRRIMDLWATRWSSTSGAMSCPFARGTPR